MTRGAERVAFGLACLVAVTGVAFTQPRLAAHFRTASNEDTVYALPPPEQLEVFTLGYRDAFADYLFGSTLVEAGIHFSEKRHFPALERYLNAIVALDPYYRDVYYYADALLTLSTVVVDKANYRAARDLEEKGAPLFSHDEMLWRSAGEFLAYLAPPHLPPNEDPDEWRTAGARMLEHACVLASDGASAGDCFSAATILSKGGELDASIAALERVVRMTQDPEVREEAEARLGRLLGLRLAEEYSASREREESRYRRELPFVPRELFELLPRDVDYRDCAGLAREAARCTRFPRDE